MFMLVDIVCFMKIMCWVTHKIIGFFFVISLVMGDVNPKQIRLSKMKATVREPKKSSMILKLCDFTEVRKIEQQLAKCPRDLFLVQQGTARYEQDYFVRHKYNVQMETRLLGEFIRYLILNLPYLRRLEDFNKIKLLIDGEEVNLTSDYIIRLKNLAYNLERHLATGEKGMTLEAAKDHVFFYTPEKTMQFLTFVFNNASKNFKDYMSSKFRSYEVLGEGNTNWSKRLCPVLQCYVQDEKDRSKMFRTSVSGSSSGTGSALATSKSPNYCVYDLFDLIRLIRHMNNHTQEIVKKYPNVVGAIGESDDEQIRYFTLRFPGLVTTIWVKAINDRLYDKRNQFPNLAQSFPFEEYESEIV